MSTNNDSGFILLRSDDDVAVAVRPLKQAETMALPQGPIPLTQNIAAGHKFSLHPVAAGQRVRKYGQTIGFATQDIPPGAHVHSHNLRFESFERQTSPGQNLREIEFVPEAKRRTFNGYLRADGRVGTRNFIAVISTVNCSASVSKYIADHFTPERLSDYPNVDGVIAVKHNTGCGMGEHSRDHLHIQRILAGLAHHPNVFDCIIVGLGCEVNQTDTLLSSNSFVQLGPRQAPSPKHITLQEAGGTRKTIAAGVAAVTDMLPRANEARRTPQPVSKLILATQCGGSDGYSGITANPALGLAADELVRQGGTAILAETTEMYGAEHLLIGRARTQAVADKLKECVDWWEKYTSMFGGTIDNNPSPGNKAGGLTTILEKSLGAIAKGGSYPLEAVYDYAAPVTDTGFTIMDTPGYDPASNTGMVAGGANVIVFTTGRGSCYGCKPVPSIKVATNPEIYRHMIDDMDINAGRMLEGDSLESVGTEIFEAIIATATGQRTKSELAGIGSEELVPWTIGPAL